MPLTMLQLVDWESQHDLVLPWPWDAANTEFYNYHAEKNIEV